MTWCHPSGIIYPQTPHAAAAGANGGGGAGAGDAGGGGGGAPRYNPGGKYLVKLMLNGVARRVVIDDRLVRDMRCFYMPVQWVTAMIALGSR